MIQSIQIKNFKSVVDLSLDLGTFNVLIGENGCGKSNILEAVAFGAAASADKLDYEFLGSRGIRVTNPEFMYSAFSNGKKQKIIEVDFETNKDKYDYLITNTPDDSRKWIDIRKEAIREKTGGLLKSILFEKNNSKRTNVLEELFKDSKDTLKLFEKLYEVFPKDKNYFEFTFDKFIKEKFSEDIISNYIVYSPEQSSLRKFEETTQIYPLGIKGEGLFQYLKELAFDMKNKKTLSGIKQNLILLDWYESFDLPENLMQNEFALKIKDKYLYPSLQYFDQRSTNEGFLFLLFYSTLFISKTTPKFFAIDNIDSSFNPKLCMQLTKNLAALAKKNKKQVIVTTQNPAILDGLNLKDNDQRLFVVRRNDEGHTKAKRIEFKTERTMKLSEVWTNGFIGGLPENF